MPHTPAEQVFWHHQAQPTEASGTSDPNHPQQQFVILQLDNSGQQHQQTATLPHMSGGYLAGLATRAFFSVPFLQKIIDLGGGQINDPSSRKPFFSSVSPSNSLVSVLDPLGLFELTRRPSRALDLPRALLPELKRYKDMVRCAALGAEVTGHRRQQQLTQTLIVRL